jgi:hypothetical protein
MNTQVREDFQQTRKLRATELQRLIASMPMFEASDSPMPRIATCRVGVLLDVAQGDMPALPSVLASEPPAREVEPSQPRTSTVRGHASSLRRMAMAHVTTTPHVVPSSRQAISMTVPGNAVARGSGTTALAVAAAAA